MPDSITLEDSPASGTLTLGAISLGAGSFTLDDFDSSGTTTVTEAGGGAITTGASMARATLNIQQDGAATVDLSGANSLAAGVTLAVNGPMVGAAGDVSFTNAKQLNALPTFTDFGIDSLTLAFNDNSALDVGALASLPTASGSFNNLAITTGGNITESAPLAAAGAVRFTSTHGSVTVDQSGNDFQGDISASATGANGITLGNNGPITLGTITLGTGSLQIDDFDSSGFTSVSEDPTETGIAITSTGSVTVNIDNDSTATVDLSGAANDLGASTSVVVNGVMAGGTVGNFGYRNINASAALSSVHLNSFSVNNLTVELDDPMENLDLGALPIAFMGNLSVTVGGNINQTMPLTVSGDLNLTVLGNTSTINLANTGNNFEDAVFLNTPVADTGAVAITNASDVSLGSSSVGAGAFTVTSVNGDIDENDGATITQAADAMAATFSAGGGDINLNGAQNIFSVPVNFSGMGVQTVELEDANPLATLASVNVAGLPSLEALTLNFDGPNVSAVLPTFSVPYNLNLTVTNNIVSLAGTTQTTTNNANLSLASTTGSINLQGAFNVAGVTALTIFNSSGNITATNGLNAFGTLDLETGSTGAATVTSAGSLTLSNVQVGALTVTAGGAINQPMGVSSISVVGLASFTTTSGAINLNASPFFSTYGSLALAVNPAGADPINVAGASATLGTLVLQSVTLGTGALSVTNWSAQAGAGIVVAGAITTAANSSATLSFTLSAGSGGVDLSNAANHFPAAVVISINGAAGGTSGKIGFEDSSLAASFTQVHLANFTTTDLAIALPNAAIAITAPINITGTLTLTAGGAISQTAGITAGSGVFTVNEDFGITLTNTGNHFGSVAFNDSAADNTKAVAFANSGTITLDSSDLGLGTFTVTTTAAGSILEQFGDTITQALGGGAVTFNAAGNTIDLGGGNENDFSGPVAFHGTGSGLTDINFENADRLATLPMLTGLATPLLSASFTLDNAPVALPTLNTGTLMVNAGGNITQLPNTPLTITTRGLFSTGAFGIQLANAGNKIADAGFNNNGENTVTVATTGALTLDSSFLGTGSFNVTSNGPITQNGQIDQFLSGNDVVAGDFNLSAGNNPILLDDADNSILGAFFVTTTGAAGNVTIVNDGSPFDGTLLGKCTVGGGLTVTDTGPGGITETADKTISVTGDAYFTAGGPITLNGLTNAIAGSVSLNTAFGAASLHVTGPVQLEGSNVAGALTIVAGGGISQMPGPLGASNDGVLHAAGGSFTSAGSASGSIILNNPGNDFGGQAVSINTGAGAVILTDVDPSGLVVGPVSFGSSLVLNAAGPVTQADRLAGAGTVAITITAAAGADVTLANTGNAVSGTGQFTLANVNNLTLANIGNIALAGSILSASSVVNLTAAGGTITFPADMTGSFHFASLTASAAQINVTQNLVTSAPPVMMLVQHIGNSDGISLTGTINISAGVTLDTTANQSNIAFAGTVNATHAFVVNLPDQGQLVLNSGVWTQNANNLTINGNNIQFNIGANNASAVFAMTGGMLTLGGTNADTTIANIDTLNVNGADTLKVGGAVTVSDGGSGVLLDVDFANQSTLLAGLGAAPGSLTLGGGNASNQISIAGATLAGFGGLAPVSAANVLAVTGGGSITGHFANPTDAAGKLFMGTDIVTATYAPSSVAVQEAGVPSATGTITGNQSDGDGYSVTATGGQAAQVLAIATPAGLEIVVRNATVATTLTITTIANGGDGFTLIHDIAIDGPGAVTISAAASNVTGNITIAGPLAALTVNNWSEGILTAGGAGSAATTITGGIFTDDSITLGSQLKTLTVAEMTLLANSANTITAASFGAITATGIAAANTPGNFNANLVNTTTASPALASANIKGTLSGNWNLAGSVGASATVGITAASTNGWTLGTPTNTAVTNVTLLSLGNAHFVSLYASGNIGSLAASTLDDSSAGNILGVLKANSFTTIKVGTNPNDHGNLIANITATGNTGATEVAIGSLTVTGSLGGLNTAPAANLTVLNGNVGTISVTGAANVNVFAASGPGIGAFTTITAGEHGAGSNFDAKTVGTWSIVGDLAAQIFGDFSTAQVNLRGIAAAAGPSVTLGTFSAARDVNSSDFQIDNGSVTTFTVGGELNSSTLLLKSAINGNVGTISAAQWNQTNLTAQAIGTLKVTGRAAAGAATPAFNGDMINSDILALATTGPTIGTFSVAGTLSSTTLGHFVAAVNGITTFSVGRAVSDYQVATDLFAPSAFSGGITTLTAGAWLDTDLAVGSLGTVNITGYATPEQTAATVSGDLTGSDWVVNPGGITSLTVAHSFTNDSINDPGGITTLVVTGQVQASQLYLMNATTASSGLLGAFTAGDINSLTLNANAGSSITVTGSAALGLNGNFNDSTVAIAGFTGSATAPVALKKLSVFGNLQNTTLNIKDGVTAFSVGQTVQNSEVAVAYDHANAAATLGSLSAGRWLSTNLVANSAATISIAGNKTFGLAGSLEFSDITFLSASAAAVALGTFSAAGAVEGTTIQVTGGNVTSFTAAAFLGSNLYVGYAIADPLDIFNDAASDQTGPNWEGNFTLGTFKTTAVLNLNDVPDSAAFQSSNVIAAKLGTITLTGLNPTPRSFNGGSPVTTFAVGFRQSAATHGTLIISGVTQPPPPVAKGSFNYFGLGG